MGFHALEISFPLEYQAPLWKHKPINFIAHFVGYEGPGSLHSYLKRKHWITSLSTGPQNLARGFAMFKITIHLTPEGFGVWHINLGGLCLRVRDTAQQIFARLF